MFKLSASYATQTRESLNPAVWTRPIGHITKVIHKAYERFGISIGEPERVKQHSYAVLKALREAVLERRGKAYTVRHVGAWLVFVAALKTLVLGDGYVSLTKLRVAVEERLAYGLAEALDGRASGHYVTLHPTMLRVLPPLLPTLFEKDVRLYRSLALFVRGLWIEIGVRRWLLGRDGHGCFRAEGPKAVDLAKALRNVIGEVPYTGNRLRLSEGKAMRLIGLGLARLLGELEYEAARLCGISDAIEEALAETARLSRRIAIN